MSRELYRGDCRELLDLLIPDGYVDAIVTDPPYELGFMGKGWDRSGVAFDVETWRQALRVLKPGGHLLAFGGTRTYHRMVCAIEDAGFEVRDQIGWVYGSGFPKSHNGEWGGTALKPAWEPIVLARKPLIGTVEQNWCEHGTGALNINGCRVGDTGATKRGSQVEYPKNPDGTEDRSQHWARTGHEIVELNLGRWPANVIHDGSDEVLAAFPQAPGQQGLACTSGRPSGNAVYGALRNVTSSPEPRGDTGSAARFFYCAKASKKDRGEGNTHPTVKPTELMRYLCRLVTPPGGVVLDPFMGSGSTGKAAVLEGFHFVGIDLSAEYIAIAEARIAAAVGVEALL